MAKSIISEGKTSNEAIEKGLKELNCKREDVEVKVLEDEEKRAFFSILNPRIVKVELTLKNGHIEKREKNETRKVATQQEIEECNKKIEKFLNKFAEQVGNITYKINLKENFIEVIIDGENSNKLIGYRGEVINALQNILSVIGNKDSETRVHISVDICGYKQKREQTLKELAEKLEKTVERTGKKVVLEPMSAYERKIIHTALQNSESVTTYSIGDEPHRKVVVEKK